MKEILEKIKTLSNANATFSIDNRRHLHKNPELSFKEKNTAVFIRKSLADMGIQPFEIADTGTFAIISGQTDHNKVVALRADIDALPITEINTHSYVSQNPGVMHACGHDVHTASLLTTAKILNEIKEQFSGTIKLIFQPAEEKAPGGASILIKEGILKSPNVNSILGQHVAPNVPVGKIGFREGMYMASTDELYLTVIGKGGHGAMPDTLIDPVLIASHIIVAMQQVISRNKKPASPSVLSFGRFIADGVTNVIPNEVTIQGTWRCMDEAWRAEGLSKIKKIAEGMADAMGARCIVDVVKGYPYLENHPELTQRMRSAAADYVGSENIVDLDLWMAGEDFAFYSQVVDACFYRLGTRNEARGIINGVHTPSFDIDEAALAAGPGLMAWMALNQLAN